MQHRSVILFISLAVTVACARHPPRPAVAPTPRVPTAPWSACPAALDIPALYARHAHAFGSREAVARALPRSFAGEIVTRGKKGLVELALGPEGRFAQTAVVGGMLSASGVDAKGPWTLPHAGVLVRLRADEDVDVAFAVWMQRRDYLSSFDPRRDVVTCTTGDASPQLSVRYDLPAIGRPELVFGLADATLSSAAHLDVDGHRAVLALRHWSGADPTGVRWPLTTQLEEASGGETLVTFSSSVSGVVCPSRPSESCLAPPLSRLTFSWPKKTPVRVPAAFFLDEIFLRVKVGSRSSWGLVDSGATVNVVDSGSPLASAFQPAATADKATPEPRSPLALGELREDVALGDLVARHFPAASVPIPSFDEFGARRPELLIGHPLFLGAAVRIDYARQRFLIAKDARSLHAKNATAVPLEVLGEIVVAEGKMDGVAGWFVLDTGDSESLDLFKDWAETHAFPGTRPSYTFRQRSEVGDGEVDEKRMRPATFELGPIQLTEPLVALDSVRSPSDRIAGQVGNGVFARCAAVVFDIQNRTLWLEPPCDRPLPENLSGWVLGRKDSAIYPDSPWVVRFVIPGGSADLAGVKAGDRIVRLGGRAAILEVGTFEAVTKRPPGTKVPVVLLREGPGGGASVRQELTLQLVRPLAR